MYGLTLLTDTQRQHCSPTRVTMLLFVSSLQFYEMGLEITTYTSTRKHWHTRLLSSSSLFVYIENYEQQQQQQPLVRQNSNRFAANIIKWRISHILEFATNTDAYRLRGWQTDRRCCCCFHCDRQTTAIQWICDRHHHHQNCIHKSYARLHSPISTEPIIHFDLCVCEQWLWWRIFQISVE